MPELERITVEVERVVCLRHKDAPPVRFRLVDSWKGFQEYAEVKEDRTSPQAMRFIAINEDAAVNGCANFVQFLFGTETTTYNLRVIKACTRMQALLDELKDA